MAVCIVSSFFYIFGFWEVCRLSVIYIEPQFEYQNYIWVLQGRTYPYFTYNFIPHYGCQSVPTVYEFLCWL